MKLYLFTNMITILLFIIRFDAVQIDPAAEDVAYSDASGYAERQLKFENWLKLSDGQRKAALSGYLSFIRTHGLKQIPVSDFETVKSIIWNTNRDELLDYINQVCTRFENASRVDGGVVDAIILQYLRNRLERDKNYNDLLQVARRVSDGKNLETKREAAYSKNDLPEYVDNYSNVFVSPYLWFYSEWWKRQDQNEKKALVSGYMVSLNEEIKRDWCDNEEERQRYDQFCKLVSVDDLVNHVDELFKNPLYRRDDAAYMIYEYMIDNFQIFIGDPIALQG